MVSALVRLGSSKWHKDGSNGEGFIEIPWFCVTEPVASLTKGFPLLLNVDTDVLQQLGDQADAIAAMVGGPTL
eukprot:5716261-Amphidinium_carterae.1